MGGSKTELLHWAQTARKKYRFNFETGWVCVYYVSAFLPAYTIVTCPPRPVSHIYICVGKHEPCQMLSFTNRLSSASGRQVFQTSAQHNCSPHETPTVSDISQYFRADRTLVVPQLSFQIKFNFLLVRRHQSQQGAVTCSEGEEQRLFKVNSIKKTTFNIYISIFITLLLEVKWSHFLIFCYSVCVFEFLMFWCFIFLFLQ